MSGKLHPELIVTQPESGRVANRNKVVILVDAAVGGEKQEPLLGNQVVELELPGLDVRPMRVEQIVEADVGCFEVKASCVVGRGNESERDILVQRSEE